MSRAPGFKPSAKCPCFSGKVYRDCCRALHRGERLPDNAVELMRSRYSGFALGEIDYLIETLHADHPDLVANRAEVISSIRTTCDAYRFMGLTIVASEDDGVTAWVTFEAKMFQKGRDVSFSERSRFLRTAGRLLYRDAEWTRPL